MCCTRARFQRDKGTELGQAAASAGPRLVGDHHGDAERLGQVLQRRSLLACQGAPPLMLPMTPLLSMLMSTKQCANIIQPPGELPMEDDASCPTGVSVLVIEIGAELLDTEPP